MRSTHTLIQNFADDNQDYATSESNIHQLVAGEPAFAFRGIRRGSSMLPASIVIAIALAAGWSFVRYPAAWQSVIAQVTALIDQRALAPVTPTVHAPPAASPPPPVEARDVSAAPGAAAGTAMPEPQITAATGAPETDDGAPEGGVAANVRVEPLSPPAADPRDPNQKRALAAGLHPGISRAVLARLTDSDFRNAAVAVRTALADTPDDDVLSYPRGASEKVAQFEVRFVEGAGAECRRYVVTVTLARWSTTALPMEKCGSALPKRTAGRKAAG